jgi:hypothetical protein
MHLGRGVGPERQGKTGVDNRHPVGDSVRSASTDNEMALLGDHSVALCLIT